MADNNPPSRGAVADFLAARYGGLISDRSRTVAAGLAVVTLCGNDPERVSLTFINLGAAEAYVSPEPNTSAALGIRLQANGGGVTFNLLEDSSLPSIEWTCLAAAAANNIYVLEVFREVAL